MKAAIGCIAAIVIALVVGGLIVGGMYVSHKNQMVVLNEQVKASWSDVDVQLQRRADLIPNLVATVKGFAQHEEKVFGDIAAARSALLNAQTPADKIAANQQVTGALGRLLAISENYPELKSNQNFLQLQDELAGTENRINVARTRYNATLKDYNTYVQQFPNSIFAKWANFQVNNAYFQTDASSKEVPKVSF
jgi:LemA protein